jgi:hypothetical protein
LLNEKTRENKKKDLSSRRKESINQHNDQKFMSFLSSKKRKRNYRRLELKQRQIGPL